MVSSRSTLVSSAAPTLVLFVTLLVSPIARGGEVPQASTARSTGIPAELLDDPALVFRYPQIAVEMAAQGFGFLTGGTSTTTRLGVGLIGRTDSQGFFFTTQRVSTTPRPPQTTSLESIVQVGWGKRIDPFRVGLAVRGAWAGDDDFSKIYYSGSERSQDVSDDTRLVEGALGVGYGGKAGWFDLVVEARSIDATHEARTVRQDGVDTRTQELDRSPRWTVAARASLPLDAKDDLLLAGGWGGWTETWTLETIEDSSLVRHEPANYEDDGSFAVAWAAERRKVDRFYLYGSYRATRTPSSAGSSTAMSSTRRTGTIGLGLGQRIAGSFVGLFGISKSYTYSRSTRYRLDPSYVVQRFDETVSEETSDFFAWGLDYSWKNVRLIGSLDGTLNLERLIASLDIRVEL